MNTNRISTKLDRIKDAIIAKIDKVDASVTSVNNSVTNLPTTLDSKFSALTSKVDGVKTDVAGVGSKVDGTKIEIKNSVDTVKTELSTSIGNVLKNVQTVEGKLSKPLKPETSKFLELSNFGDSNMKTVVNVTGSGVLSAAYFIGSVDPKYRYLEIIIDGTKYLLSGDTGSQYPYIFLGYLSLPFYTYFSPSENSDGNKGPNIWGNLPKSLLDAKNKEKNGIVSTLEPVKFNKSLVINAKNNIDKSLCIAYCLS